MRTLTLALLLAPLLSFGAEKPITTRITAVKVFLSGAEVTRTGSIDLPKGTSTLLFAGLSDEVDPANIQVSGNGSFTILGVQHRLNYLEEKLDRAEVTELKARIKAAEADLTKENSLLAVLEKEDARLAKNDVIAGDQGLSLEQLRSINDYLLARQEGIALKRLERHARVDDLNEQLRKLQLQLNQVQGKKARATSEVLVEVSANAAVEAALTLKYMVRSAGWSPSYDIRVADITKPLQLTYKAQVYQSTGEEWKDVQLALSSGQPNKDAIMPELRTWRLDFGMPPSAYATEKNYNANVRDVRGILRDATTGEPLPFATVSLMDAGGNILNGTATNADGYYAIAIPALGRTLQFTYIGYQSQHLSIYNGTMNVNMAPVSIELKELQIRRSGVERLSAKQIEAMPSMSGEADHLLPGHSGVVSLNSTRRIRRQKIEFGEDDYDAIENVSASTSLAEAVVQRTTTFEFPISVPYTIPSDGQNHQVGVQEQELKSTYRYYCTPKLDLDAFLFAQVTGWEGLNLLAGPAYIYFEGTYVGESLLDLGGVGDTLDISLGRDKGVSVQRTKRKDFSQRQVVGNKRTESVGWEIAVRNNKPQAIELTITDQFPVAARNEIEVKLDEDGGAEVNAEKGFLTWKVAVGPRTNQQWRFGYSVKVPKERVVVLE
ncbi:MAG: mucoidy inhibitor MuiA family protein [Flavobacteriales bacterium]|nr:MAG: mucoidy inhibitor MuiA family protein [Flavobacteriales bacterium]